MRQKQGQFLFFYDWTKVIYNGDSRDGQLSNSWYQS